VPWRFSRLTKRVEMTDSIEIFATSPQSLGADPRTYKERVIQTARWSESAGCTGTLVYTDNSIVDPWMVADTIIQHTASLCPLVAVQPIYMHPYTAAKMAATLAYLHGRRIYLNMVAGGFANDLAALNDRTPHDRRYARLAEYVEIISRLLDGGSVSFTGEFYGVTNLRLCPPVPAHLRPGMLMSGSSESGLATARACGATAVVYPGPSSKYRSQPSSCSRTGIRVGIIARSEAESAWETAHARFPADRKGQLTHELAMKVSDSVWHKELSQTARMHSAESTYWLVPFENSRTNCPYLVGSYATVASELAAYMTARVRTFILDIPHNEEEFEHISIVFRRAMETLTVSA
jgi:alkanesulfonate monooxygenase